MKRKIATKDLVLTALFAALILISLPVILVQKIFGKIKYGKSLYQ